MLDQKIKMLQGEKDQILNKINEKENNLKNMFNELIKQSGKNSEMFMNFKQFNIKSTIHQKSEKTLEEQIVERDQILKNFQTYLLKIL